jgi:hypothetical protein
MQRRLEDVSHFFFDHPDSVPRSQALAPRAQGIAPRSRVIHVAGFGDHVTAGMIVAGLAATASRMGCRVLAAQTHEQVFGVAFGLGAATTAAQSAIVQAAPSLWVSPTSLLGARRPGVLFDPPAAETWLARAALVDLVLVHVNYGDGTTLTSAVPIPDEFIVVAGERGHEAAIPLYRAVKRAVSWNPRVELGIVAAATHDDRSRSGWNKLVQAAATFLGRPCPMVGAITDVSALSRAFLSGTLLRGESNEGARELMPIAGRWARSVPGVSRFERDAADGDRGGNMGLPGRVRRCQ